MKKRKGSLLQRMLAVLLAAVLVTGMVSNVAPASVLAQESGAESVSGNDAAPEAVAEPQPGTASGNPAADEENGNLQALLERIAALPDVTEYLVAEPKDGDAYEEWLTGMYAYAEETLAMQEVVEALSEEEQAKIPEKTLAKLEAWVTVAGQAEESNMVMAAAVSGDGWELSDDGKLTIKSDAGMTNWINNRNTYRTQVKRVEIQDGVASIGEDAFRDCINLTSIVIPLDVTNIGVGAFFDCYGLTEIEIPSSVKNIGKFAFRNCTKLNSVTMDGEMPPTLGGDAFDFCPCVYAGTKGIHVPVGTAETYKKAEGWSDYQDHITDDTPTPPAGEHKHNDVTFTAWTATNSLPDAAGNYYLTENVTLSDTWNVPSGETTLCLNGKTISASGTKEYEVITIPESGTLNLYDCQNAGNITGGKSDGVWNNGTFCMYGGKISGNSNVNGDGGVLNNGTFYMYGGEISGNTAETGHGGVQTYGKFNMYGGKIINNECNGEWVNGGGGVYINGGGSFTVGGSAVISGNTCNGEENNVYLRNSDARITIDSEKPLSGSANIGVTTETAPTEGNPVNVTGHNKGDYSQYFHSDNPAYGIVNANDVVQLTVKTQSHTHNLTLTPAKSATCTEDGNMAYYTCDGCDKWFSDAEGTQEITDKDSVIISKTGHSYDESAWGYQAAEGHARKCRNCDAHDTVQPHMPGEAATESTPQTCTVCGYIIVPATGHTHNLTLTPAKSATCTEDGNTAYYTCDGCDKWFSDAEGTQEITDKDSVIISQTGHSYDESAWGYRTAEGHAHNCRNCDAHDTVQSHTPGAAATESTPQTCTVCGYIIAPATGADPGTGTVTPEVKPGVNAPATNISTPTEELKDMLLTEEEKQQVQNGTDIRIVLEVQDAGNTVSVSDRAAIQQALNGFTEGQYLNIDLYKLVGADRTDITETAKKIRIVITVPETLRNTDGNMTRTFAVIRLHDGRAEVLADLDDSVDTITIETDRFSTYAVAYKDNASGGVGDNDGNGDNGDNGGNDSGNTGDNGGDNGNSDNNNSDNGNSDNSSNQNSIDSNDPKQAPTKDSEPKTGDAAPLELYATLAMIAGFAYLLLYFADRKRGMTEETKRELVSRLVGWAKQGGKIRKCLALAAVFVLLVYYHSIGKKTCAQWQDIYEE